MVHCSLFNVIFRLSLNGVWDLPPFDSTRSFYNLLLVLNAFPLEVVIAPILFHLLTFLYHKQ